MEAVTEALPAADTLTAAEDIRPEEGVGTPAAADTLEEATRAAEATAAIAKASRQVLHLLQLFRGFRFDVASELM